MRILASLLLTATRVSTAQGASILDPATYPVDAPVQIKLPGCVSVVARMDTEYVDEAVSRLVVVHADLHTQRVREVSNMCNWNSCVHHLKWHLQVPDSLLMDPHS